MLRVAIGLLGVIALSIVGNAVFVPTSAHAQSVEQASAKLSKTETQLAKEVTKSANGAASVAQELQSPSQPGLAGQLQEFGRTNDRLKQLQVELTKDIGSFEEARAAKLATLDLELQAIKDSTTRRQMERLLPDLLAAVAEDVRQAGQRIFLPAANLGRVDAEHLSDPELPLCALMALRRLWPSSWVGDSCAFVALTLLDFQCRPP